MLKAALNLSRGQVLISGDQISCGPAPATDDLDQWRSLREDFFRDTYRDLCVEGPGFSFDADIELLTNAERLGQEKQVVVWAGSGLPEQLLLAWVIFLFDRLEFDLSKLRVIQIEELRPGRRVLAIGELNSESIQERCSELRRLDAKEVEELRRAWRVYTSSDPAVLSGYIAGASPMPALHRAMGQLVLRYPDIRSGVGLWDEFLLRHTAQEGPGAVRVIGYTLGDMSDTLDWAGDLYLFRRLIDLASPDLASPLISTLGNVKAMRDCRVRLTAFGQKVLEREANHVAENGIDEWIGGVHLSTGEPITYRDGNALLLDL